MPDDSKNVAELPKEGKKDVKDDKDTKQNNTKEMQPDLSPEDLQQKADLDLCVERIGDQEVTVQKLALDTIVKEIKSSTTSMTSVPKPLKFLRPHYATLKEQYTSYPEGENKTLLADVISVLAMTYQSDNREGLRFKLKGCTEELGSWGHEYVRYLAGETSKEFHARMDEGEQSGMTPNVDDLLGLVKQMVPFFIQHNAEPEAVDMLMEVNRLEDIVEFADETNFTRILVYIQQAASYVPSPDDAEVLKTAIVICQNLKKYPDALRIAMRLNNPELTTNLFQHCDSRSKLDYQAV